MITDDKKSILERVNFFVLFSFDLTLQHEVEERVQREGEHRGKRREILSLSSRRVRSNEKNTKKVDPFLN